MACGCNSNTPSTASPFPQISPEPGFPTVADYASLNPEQVCDGTETACGPTAVQPVCLSNSNLTSQIGPATQLAGEWLATECKDQGVTLLARVGRTLTRFTGSGFLQLTNGKATLVSSIRLQVTELFHFFWKPGSYPVLGNPKPYDLEVVADKFGALYGIKGYADLDSVKVWDYAAKKWAVRPVADFPICIRRLLPRTQGVELTGFIPLAENADPTTVRCLTRLGGEGIVMLTEQPTVPSECICEGCQPVEAVASVATIIPLPEESDDSYGFGRVDGEYGFFQTEELFAGVVGDLRDDLDTEIASRTSADATLQANITAEAGTRAAAIITTQTAVTTEANSRALADATLQTNINNEIAARIAYVAASSGTTNPVISATRLGQFYVNTTTAQGWMSTTVGNASADWKQVTV